MVRIKNKDIIYSLLVSIWEELRSATKVTDTSGAMEQVNYVIGADSNRADVKGRFELALEAWEDLNKSCERFSPKINEEEINFLYMIKGHYSELEIEEIKVRWAAFNRHGEAWELLPDTRGQDSTTLNYRDNTALIMPHPVKLVKLREPGISKVNKEMINYLDREEGKALARTPWKGLNGSWEGLTSRKSYKNISYKAINAVGGEGKGIEEEKTIAFQAGVIQENKKTGKFLLPAMNSETKNLTDKFNEENKAIEEAASGGVVSKGNKDAAIVPESVLSSSITMKNNEIKQITQPRKEKKLPEIEEITLEELIQKLPKYNQLKQEEKTMKNTENKKAKLAKEIIEPYDPKLKSIDLFAGKAIETGINHDETIREISDLIKEGDARLQKGGDRVILLLGNTGSGKSTLAYFLSGQGMQAIRDDSTLELVIEALEPTKEIVIGHNMTSETRIPNKCTAKESFIGHNMFSGTQLPNKFSAGEVTIWDCPGFYDTDLVQEIANSFYIKRLFEINASLRLVLLVPEAHLIESRGKSFIDTITSFMKCFNELKIPMAHTSLVISKVNTNKETVHIQNLIDNILTQNHKITPEQRELISKLKAGLSLFHKPKEEGVIDPVGNDLKTLINPSAVYAKSDSYSVNMGISPEANKYSSQLLASALNNFNKIAQVVALAMASPTESLKAEASNLFIENYDLIKGWIPSKMDYKSLGTHKTDGYFPHLDHLSLLDKLLSGNAVHNMAEGVGVLRKVIDLFAEYAEGNREFQHQLQNYGYVLSQQYEYVRFFIDICKEKLPASQELRDLLSECQQKVKQNLEYQIKTMQISQGESDSAYYEKAIKYLEHYPDSINCKTLKAQSYCVLASIAKQKGNNSEALKYYVKAIDSDHELAPSEYEKIGELFYEKGEYAKAIGCYKVVNNSLEVLECYKEWLKSDPKNSDIILAKAEYLNSIGMFEKAKLFYHKACGLINNESTKDKILTKIGKMLTEGPELGKSMIQKAENHDYYNYDTVNDEFIKGLAGDMGPETDTNG